MKRLAIGIISLVAILLVQSFFWSKGSSNKVSVYNWSNYVSQDLLTNFEEETGIKVHYNVFDSNESLETSLLVGGSGYDVVTPSASYLRRQILAGAYQKLDTSLLPNLGLVWPYLSDKLSSMGAVNQYSVTYAWGTSGLGYDRAKLLQLVPAAPLDSMALLFDEKIVSLLAPCGIYVLDSSDEIIPAALNYLGLEPTSQKKEDIQLAAALLKRIQPYIRKFHSSAYVDALANGEACLVFGWSGDILQAKAAAQQAGNGVDITYVIPREGGQIWFDQMAIPSSSKNKENAHAFINFILDPKNNAQLSKAILYPTALRLSAEQLPPALEAEEGFYPSAAIMQRLYNMPNYYGEMRKFVSQLWLEIKLGL